MIEPPRIADAPARIAAVIPLTVPRGEIREAMGPAFGELMAALEAQGLAPAGPFFSHHLRMDPGIFDFELGVPLATPVAPGGRVVRGGLSAGRVARTVLHGGYEGLGAAWGELQAWVRAEGHTPAPDMWVSYTVGPESSPDRGGWRTELNQPLLP